MKLCSTPAQKNTLLQSLDSIRRDAKNNTRIVNGKSPLSEDSSSLDEDEPGALENRLTFPKIGRNATARLKSCTEKGKKGKKGTGGTTVEKKEMRKR